MTLEQLLAAQRYFVLLRQRRGPLVPPTKTGTLQQRTRLTVMQPPAVSLSGPNGVNVLADAVTAHPSDGTGEKDNLSRSADAKKGLTDKCEMCNSLKKIPNELRVQSSSLFHLVQVSISLLILSEDSTL